MEISDSESEEVQQRYDDGEFCFNNGFVSLRLDKSCLNSEMLIYYY